MRKFIKELIRDFAPAYKQLKKRWQGKLKIWPAPFDKGPLNPPGRQSYQELISRIVWTAVASGVTLGVYISSLIAAIAFGSLNYLYLMLPVLLPLSALLPVIYYQLRNYQLGYRGEQIVAGVLEECFRKPTWRLFHDLCIPSINGNIGNIDHVVVCPKGVFCIETKTTRWGKGKEIAVQDNTIFLDGEEFKGTSSIGQVRGNARDLRDFLQKQCPFVQFVFPIILFADDDDSNHFFSDEFSYKLIVGKSGGIKSILNEFSDKPDVLTKDQVDKIGKVLEEQNRVSMDT